MDYKELIDYLEDNNPYPENSKVMGNTTIVINREYTEGYNMCKNNILKYIISKSHDLNDMDAV